jgi:hypothetical protein
LLGDLIKGGGAGCLATETHGMPSSRPQGCGVFRQITSN